VATARYSASDCIFITSLLLLSVALLFSMARRCICSCFYQQCHQLGPKHSQDLSIHFTTLPVQDALGWHSPKSLSIAFWHMGPSCAMNNGKATHKPYGHASNTELRCMLLSFVSTVYFFQKMFVLSLNARVPKYSVCFSASSSAYKIKVYTPCLVGMKKGILTRLHFSSFILLVDNHLL